MRDGVAVQSCSAAELCFHLVLHKPVLCASLTPGARAGAAPASYAQAVAFSVCERCVRGISMVDISVISNTTTEGISILASIVELSVGDQRRC